MESVIIVLLAFLKIIQFFVGGTILLGSLIILVQLVSYQVFNFNLCKFINSILFEEV